VFFGRPVVVMADVFQSRRSLSIADIPIPAVPASASNARAITAIVFLSLGWVAVLLRLWTRAVVIRSLGADDITMAISMVRKLFGKLHHSEHFVLTLYL
jgi:hypothetical protein